MDNGLKALVILAACAATPAFADGLDDAAVICRKHQQLSPVPIGPKGQPVPLPLSQSFATFEIGWEGCPAVLNAWSTRKDAADAADEATNPEKKTVNDAVRSLPK